MSGRALVDRIVARAPLEGHDGASGATLERARLSDGSAVVLKTFDAGTDLTMRAAGRSVPLDVELWRAGVLDRVPAPLAHPVLDAWREDGSWVLAMHDLGGRLLGYDSVIGRAQCRQVLAAASALHAAFAGQDIAGLWPLRDRLAVFSPRVMRGLAGTGSPLPAWCLDGWGDFAEQAPRDVVDLVEAVHEQPDLLAEPLLARGGRTLLHGDYWLANLAPDRDRVTVIDWALATSGPPVCEFTSFLVGCAGQVRATREEILDDLRGLAGPEQDEPLLRLGLLGGVVEMGWNLGWHAARGADGAREALDWWVAAARRAVATRLLR